MMDGGRAIEGEGVVWKDEGRGSSPGLIIAHVHSCSWAAIFVHGGCLCLWTVVFVGRQSPLFMDIRLCSWTFVSMGSCLHSWAAIFAHGWSYHWYGVVVVHW